MDRSIVGIAVTPTRIAGWLWGVLLALLALSVGGHIAAHAGLGWNMRGYNKAFDLDSGDVSGFFGGTTCLIAAALAGGIGAAIGCSGRDALRWKILAVLTALFSLDRAAAIHAILPRPTGHAPRLMLMGTLAVAAIMLLAAYLPLWWHLRPAIRWSIAAGIGLFLLSAGPIQRLEDAVESSRGQTLAYDLLTDAEEFVELAGTIVVIHALARQLRERTPEVRLEL